MNNQNIKANIINDAMTINRLNNILEDALQINNTKAEVDNCTLDDLVRKNQKLSLRDKAIYLLNIGKTHLFKVKTLKILITAEDEIKKLNNYFDNEEHKKALEDIYKDKVKMNAKDVLNTLNENDKIVANIELGTNHLIYEQQVKHSSDIMTTLRDNGKLDDGFKYYVLTGTHVNKDFKEDTKRENVHCKELTQAIVESKGFKADYNASVSKFIGRANTVDTYKKLFQQNPSLMNIIKSDDSSKKIVVNAGISAFAYRTQADLLSYLSGIGITEEQFKNHFVFTSMPLENLVNGLKAKGEDKSATKQEQKAIKTLVEYKNSTVIDNLARTFYTRKSMYKRMLNRFKALKAEYAEKDMTQLTIGEVKQLAIEQ